MTRNLLYLFSGAVLLAGCVSVHKNERITEDARSVPNSRRRSCDTLCCSSSRMTRRINR